MAALRSLVGGTLRASNDFASLIFGASLQLEGKEGDVLSIKVLE